MSILQKLQEQAALLWKFLGFFQPPLLRSVHALIIALVVLQMLSSAGMHIRLAPTFSTAPTTFLFNWYHIIAGLCTAALAYFMMAYCFSQRGLRRYFPYLWGDTARIKADLRDSLQGKMPSPTAGGLATTVQGLGFGALFLTVFSGVIWFCLWTWSANVTATHMALNVHKSVVNLLVLYFIGHGTMALLHFVLWQQKTKQR